MKMWPQLVARNGAAWLDVRAAIAEKGRPGSGAAEQLGDAIRAISAEGGAFADTPDLRNYPNIEEMAFVDPPRRNFSVNPATWTKFGQNCDTTMNNTDDFYFRIEFVTHSAGTAIGGSKNIFSGGNRQGSVDIFQNGDTFFIRSRTSSGSLISLNPVIENGVRYVISISFAAGMRTITMNDVVLYSAADSAGGFVLNSTKVYTSTDNVEIYGVSLENLSSPTLVWEANFDELHDTGIIRLLFVKGGKNELAFACASAADYHIDWGDGTTSAGVGGAVMSHVYTTFHEAANGGKPYNVVAITGAITSFAIKDLPSGNEDIICRILWAYIKHDLITSLYNAFYAGAGAKVARIMQRLLIRAPRCAVISSLCQGCNGLLTIKPLEFAPSVVGSNAFPAGAFKEFEVNYLGVVLGSLPALQKITVTEAVYSGVGIGSTPLLGLKSITLPGALVNGTSAAAYSFANSALDHDALLALFRGLPANAVTQNLTLTGSVGASELTAEDIAIATNKNWNVIL